MKNLFRTLIPYKWTALLVLLLMAGQAFCEMNLPQYTQALIDTGIQNRGIEHIVPEAITGTEFKEAGALMTDGQRSLWENAFDTETPDNDGVYHRRNLSEDELDELDEVLLTPLVRRYAEKNGETLTERMDRILLRSPLAYPCLFLLLLLVLFFGIVKFI